MKNISGSIVRNTKACVVVVLAAACGRHFSCTTAEKTAAKAVKGATFLKKQLPKMRHCNIAASRSELSSILMMSSLYQWAITALCDRCDDVIFFCDGESSASL